YGQQRRGALRLDQHLDRPLGGAAALDPLPPHVTVGQGLERQPQHLWLGARAADPAVQLATFCHHRPVADTRRRPPLDAHYGRERERCSLVRQAAGFDEDVHSARPTSSSAPQTLSDVSGMSMFRTPAWASASMTAFTNAAGEPTVADSPTPLAPIGWCGDGGTVSPSSKPGVSHDVRSRESAELEPVQ